MTIEGWIIHCIIRIVNSSLNHRFRSSTFDKCYICTINIFCYLFVFQPNYHNSHFFKLRINLMIKETQSRIMIINSRIIVIRFHIDIRSWLIISITFWRFSRNHVHVKIYFFFTGSVNYSVVGVTERTFITFVFDFIVGLI